MLVSMAELLKKARAEGYGITAPNVQSEDTVRAVIAVAEELRAPMIIDLNYHANPDIVYLGRIITDLAERATVPIASNLDHGKTFEEIMWGIRAGLTSVMVDRSSLSYEENVRQTKEVVKMCRPLGISVEAELGHVGMGDQYEVDGKQNLTDPELAARFIEETGVDCLAVAVGTAHGRYIGTPHIDFERLEEIVKACGDTPLVLHGGSGTGAENLARAVKNGVQKVNLNTDLFQGGREKLNEVFVDPYYKGLNIMPTFMEGYREKLAYYVKLFGQDHRA